MSAPKLLQYQNGERNSANGVELELGGKVFEKIETTASIALQRTTESDSRSFPTYSPGFIGKFLVFGAALDAANRMSSNMLITLVIIGAVNSAISIGYSDESPRDFSARRRPLDEIVHRGRWTAGPSSR